MERVRRFSRNQGRKSTLKTILTRVLKSLTIPKLNGKMVLTTRVSPSLKGNSFRSGFTKIFHNLSLMEDVPLLILIVLSSHLDILEGSIYSIEEDRHAGSCP